VKNKVHFFAFIIYTSISFFVFMPTAKAQEVMRFFSGIRMMGMGGAGIATVNDETALLENPAGLGKLRDMYGTIIDPELDVGQKAYDMNQVQNINNALDLNSIKPSLDANLDTHFHAKAAVFPSFVVRNFGLGIYYRKVLDAYEDTAGTTIKANYWDDMALILGYNLRLFDGRIKFGFNGKFISRIAIENASIPTSTGTFTLAQNAVEGAGIGTDVGLIMTAPWAMLPTLSAVVRDVGGTPFTSGSGLRLSVPNRPTKIEQDIDVAVALFPIHSNRVRSAFTLEYQKLAAAAKDSDKTRYYHGGWELNVADIFFLRAGMNQRYWTAGMELASENLQLQFASYGEDVGLTGSPLEDRRYMFKFSFRY
jgi:hypothetical protein